MSLKLLIADVLAAVTSLTTGQKFYDMDGTAVAIKTYSYRLPEPEDEADVDGCYPFAVCRILGGGEDPTNGSVVCRLFCGIYAATEGNFSGGNDDIDRLLGFLRGFARNQDFSPYSLESMHWQLGDEEGLQAPNKYYLTVDLNFVGETAFIEE
jgi:hypothetical protein